MLVIIKELKNLQSERDGTKFEVKDLAAAKRKAAKEQCFHGTHMVIETEGGLLLAHKSDGRWFHAN